MHAHEWMSIRCPLIVYLRIGYHAITLKTLNGKLKPLFSLSVKVKESENSTTKYAINIIADLFEFPGILHAYLSIFGFGYITSYTPLALKFKVLNFSFLVQIDMLYFGHCC